jgi:hypothetical protein
MKYNQEAQQTFVVIIWSSNELLLNLLIENKTTFHIYDHESEIFDFSILLSSNRNIIIENSDVRYDSRIKTMFGSSLPPVVCRRTGVLFTLFVFVCA